MELHSDFDLKPYNTFGIGARAKFYFRFKTENELLEFQVYKNKHLINVPVCILGEGSNTLFSGDFGGIVLHPANNEIEVESQTASYVFIRAGAGTLWDNFVEYCVSQNWGGIENQSHIPGSVGACPVQNIGAYGVEAKDTIVSLRAYDVSSANVRVFTNSECEFDYRDSVFKKMYSNTYIILSVLFKLTQKPVLQTGYTGVEEELKKSANSPPTIRDVRKAIIEIRKRKLPDFTILGNAGSFFRNPIIDSQQFQSLKQTYPLLPYYEAENQRYKIPAAYLIEYCGWKGRRVGDAGVYDQQPLVLVNYGRATGKEIIKLAEDIQKSVFQRFNIKLIPEVRIV